MTLPFDPTRDNFHCLLCGKDDCLRLDLDDPLEIDCSECGGTFKMADVETRIEEYRCLLSMVKATVTARTQFVGRVTSPEPVPSEPVKPVPRSPAGFEPTSYAGDITGRDR